MNLGRRRLQRHVDVDENATIEAYLRLRPVDRERRWSDAIGEAARNAEAMARLEQALQRLR